MTYVDFQHVSKRFGATIAVDDFSLRIEDGEFVILVGPSGCGKTTVLRMLAGLEEVTSGEIRIGDRVVNDLPPVDRDIAMVFQNYALYPHMTVEQNLAFPLRQMKMKKSPARARAAEVASLLDIEPLLKRKPRELSGGQRQRVAIGRALVREPQAFLMDEPLSNLDAKLRVQMRAELIALHQRLGITTIYVTHDQTEAMTLGDRVVVLESGVVQQVDTPERLYRQPANVFVAGFIGSPAMNFLHGRLEGARLDLGSGSLPLPDAVRARLVRQSGEVIVGVRPEDFVLSADGDSSLSLSAVVVITEQLGSELLAYFRTDGLRFDSETLVARLESDAPVRNGEKVEMSISADRVQLFDPDTRSSLFTG